MADLPCVDFSRAILDDADLSNSKLQEACFVGTRLLRADLRHDFLARADLTQADLSRAKPVETNLSGAKLFRATLTDANLALADLMGAKLGKAVLCGANLSGVRLVETDLNGADLTGCRVYGVSAWNVNLTRVQPILRLSDREYAMFQDFLSRSSVLPIFRYKDERHLLRNLVDKVIQPAQERRTLIGRVRALGRSWADLYDEQTRRVRTLEKEVQRLRGKK